MAGDWSGPTKDSHYLSLIDDLKARDVDAGTMGTPVNPPVGFKRWSSAARRIEEWTGTAWLPLPMAGAWIDFGHVPAYVSGTVMRITGDVTADYTAGRRIRATLTSGQRVGVIASAVYDGINGWTTITVTLDSGALGSTLSGVAVSIFDTADALPVAAVTKGGTGAATVADALTNLGVPFCGVATRTASGAEALADRGRVLICTGSITRTVPASSVGAGVVLAWHNAGSGAVTLARTGADLLAGREALLLYAGETAALISDGAGSWRPVLPLAARLVMPSVDRTGSVTLDASADAGRLQRCSGTLTLTLPSAATAGAGWVLPVINTGAGVVTLARSGADLIGGAASRTLAYQGDAVTVRSTGSGWDVIGAVNAGGTPMDGFAAQILDIF